jgi:transposase
MEITSEQFAQMKPYLPRQRGNVLNQNIAIINAILWLAENDCKWSALPRRFGSWHTVYTRVHRWANAGVLDRVFEQMQRLQLIRIRLEIVTTSSGDEAGGDATEAAGRTGAAPKSRRMPSMDLTSELPKFAWVPRIRVCHRRLAAARRRGRKSSAVRAASTGQRMTAGMASPP